MKRTTTLLKYLPAGVAGGTLALTLLVSPVALARQGADDSSRTSTVSTGTTTPTTSETHQTRGNTATTSSSSESETEANDDSVRSQAKSLLQAERQKAKEHTQAQRQQACEAHKTELAKREVNYSDAAQRHLDTFNSIFTKVQAFQTRKHLAVANYDMLVATATAKQTAAQAAVTTLKAQDVTIDCTQADPAGSVATLKTAVQNARTALQDYRSAIKDVIVALKGASTSSSTTTGGAQ